jgi:tRNA modification GTPase
VAHQTQGFVDTIVAQATPPGRGAQAVVRWSGPRAFDILRALLPQGNWPEARRVSLCRLVDPRSGEWVDEGLVTRFEAPNSFTGEDVVEFSGHGGRLVPALVVDAVVAAGARRAEAGEFSRRAYLHGRLDLTQVEAISDLIDSRSRRQLRQALRQYDRGLALRINELREALLELEASVAHHVDFPEEDDAPTPIDSIAAKALEVAEQLRRLLETSRTGERVRAGALVVLAGAPNSGKSSLFNALLGEERAIVTPVAGTTRDALEAEVEVDGFFVRLVDTAGVRVAEDVLEAVGIEVATRFVGAADIVVFCIPAHRSVSQDEAQFLETLPDAAARVLLVRTMSDVGSEVGVGAGHIIAGQHVAEITISAHTGVGLSDLEGALSAWLASGDAGDDEVPVLTRERHREGVANAQIEVARFASALGGGVPAEMAAAHLREAESSLEGLVGAIDHEEVLDRVFRSFCIGK